MTMRATNIVRCAAAALMVWLCGTARAADKVVTLRVPDGGNAPQVATDEKGTVHLVYFKAARGDHGNLFYVRSGDGGATFSKPLRVNSRANDAMAARPPRLAVGKGGRPHVVWNGVGDGAGMPLLYARLSDAGDAFEPERNLMQKSTTLDGGATAAADLEGNVYGVWHARPAGSSEGEQNRRVFVARSSDEGKTFGTETVAWDEPTGACGCCHVGAFTDDKGVLYILFRGAETAIERDIYLLVSADHGTTFKGSKVDPWRTSACPMSSMALARTAKGVQAGWETEGRVRFGRVDASTGTVVGRDEPTPAGARPDRKAPEIATNSAGETIRVWTEGMGWKKGGTVAWQVYDPDGRPTETSGRQQGVPPDGDAAVFARRDGTFVVIY